MRLPCVLLGLLAAWPAPVLAAETAASPVTREAVLDSLETHAPAWAEKLRGASPRLFFSDTEWRQIRREIDAPPPERAALTAAFFAQADLILAEPIPAYLPPAQMIGKPHVGSTLFAAMEELWQREVGNHIFALAVAARLRPDAAYRAKLHDLVMAAIRFDTWGRSNNPRMGDNADLAIGHIGRGIAVAYDWHRAAFTDAERAQIRSVVAARLPCLLKGLYGDAYWAAGYEENHNHVSVAALAFCGLAFYDEIPGAPEWLAAARLNFQSVGRHMPADGSSVEGVSYWSYGMSYILQYIEATRPVVDSADLYQLPFLKNAAAYRLLAATPGLVGNLPWGDSVPRGWTTPHHILYRLAAHYNDHTAAWFADHLPPPRGGADDHALNMLWARNAPPAGPAPLTLDGRLTVNDLVTTRSGWAATDYVLSIKAGYTNRNHSHLDAGALGLAFGDEWLLIAPGYGKGAGDGAFWNSGGPRWNYFSNATESHATLLVNGKNQRFDREARATVTRYFSSPDWNATTVDLTRAYHDVTSLTREVLHRRGDYILVFDSATAAQPVTVEWLAQFRGSPAVEPDGALLASGQNGSLRVRMLFPDTALTPREPISPKVDVKRQTHVTLSTARSGTTADFVALLQPLPAAKNTAPLTALVKFGHEGGRLKITGPGWTDHLACSTTTPVELTFSVPEQKKESRITARLAIVRTTATTTESFLALDATAIDLPGLSRVFETARDLSGHRNPDGTWGITP